MAVLPIRTYGDPVLRRKAAPVEKFDDELRQLAEDMIETMQVARGIGLAAPQVGVSMALCVVDMGLIKDGDPPRSFINPEIIEEFGDIEVMEEGCLSIPDINEDVPRRQGIRLRYQDIGGHTHEAQCTDLLARVLQHEIDHLHGIFFTDRLRPFRRKLLAKRLREIATGVREKG